MGKDNKNKELKALAWNFSEYYKHDRKKGWYIWTTALSLLLIIYAILTVNFLFALIVIMFDIILLLDQRREPRTVHFKIDYQGIHLGNKIYRYNEFDKFWIVYQPPHIKTLYLDYKTSLKPSLSVPLKKQHPLEVRTLLKRYLQEDIEREQESFSDLLSRVLKI